MTGTGADIGMSSVMQAEDEGVQAGTPQQIDTRTHTHTHKLSQLPPRTGTQLEAENVHTLLDAFHVELGSVDGGLGSDTSSHAYRNGTGDDPANSSTASMAARTLQAASLIDSQPRDRPSTAW